jgi:Bifunctional DNA primase/polymerase, N-terminal
VSPPRESRPGGYTETASQTHPRHTNQVGFESSVRSRQDGYIAPTPEDRADDLIATALAIRELPASVISATDIGVYAIEAAVNNWQVGPLCKRDRGTGRILHPYGKDPVGRLVPHGVLDFTSDVDTVSKWWSQGPWNIGVRVPASMFVLDVDGPDRRPHPGKGLQALAALEDSYGPLPTTFTQITGSGGLHLFFRRPPGKFSKTRLPAGLEYKDHGGYIVLAPSRHPDTGERYVRCDHPVAAPPAWLIDLLLPEKTAHRITPTRPRSPLHGRPSGFFSGSIADNYCQSTTWPEILMPHGWSCLSPNPDADGAKWLHPTATSSCSATIKNGCLFVYSPNTPFKVTESGNVNGYTKFRAFAVLNHDGDMSVAAHALMAVI